MKRRRVLFAIDSSEATERATVYLGRILGDRSDIEIHLLHVLPPLPPELLETGGAGDAETLARIEAEQEEEQRAWIAQKTEAARPIFDHARTRLLEEGIDPTVVREHTMETIPEDRVHQRILDAAAECDCATVVVGRTQRDWVRDLFNRHVSHQVVKSGAGLTVWVVG